MPTNYNGQNLSDHDFDSQDLTNADLRNTILTGASFKRANLTGCDFTGATFGGTIFDGCDLSRCTFSAPPAFATAQTKPTSFHGATVPFTVLGNNWSYLDLRSVTIPGLPEKVSFLSAVKSTFDSRTPFAGKTLANAHFKDCSMQSANFTGTTLSNAVFAEECDLTGAVFAHANLQNAVFNTATLTNADFRNAASMDTVSLQNTRLDGTRFDDLDVTSCIFSVPPRVSTDPAHLTSFAGGKINLSMIGKVWSYLNLDGTTIVGLGSGVDLTSLLARYANVGALNFSNYTLANADFTGAAVAGTNFTSAQLGGAIFKGAQGDTPRFNNAVLTGANFGPIGVDGSGRSAMHGACFDGAQMTGAVCTKADFGPAANVNSSFVGTTLNGVDFSNATLASAQLTGGVTLHNSDLSNANLESADLSGAQLGSLSELFRVQSTAADYAGFLAALQTLSVGTIIGEFAAHQVTLSPDHTTVSSDVPNRAWTITDGNTQYNVLKRTFSSGNVFLVVSAITRAATLTGAYLPNATLTDANLYSVNAEGIHFYGTNALLDGSAVLDNASLTKANLGTANLTGALLYGTDLSYASLVNARLGAAMLLAASTGKEASLAYAQLQGADFTGAQVEGADLSNAAVSVPIGSSGLFGVFLFSIPSGAAIVNELTNSANNQIFVTDPGQMAAIESDLTAGSLANVSAILNQQGTVSFSGSATVSVTDYAQNSPRAWEITDPSPPAGQISPYTLFIGWDLNGDPAVVAQPSLDVTRAAFASPALAWEATAAVITAGQQWTIDNDSENPLNLQTGYVQFAVVLESDGSLSVYGTTMHVRRLGDGNQLALDVVDYDATVLCQATVTPIGPDGSNSAFGADTTCPNGRTLGNNQGDNIPWPIMLRAQAVPAGPTCVPSPFGNCPQN